MAMELFSNPGRAARDEMPGAVEQVFPLGELREAAAIISRWQDYGPTPLIALPGLAQALGVAKVLYKHEGGRFGLGSFKALGGAFAVYLELADLVRERTGVAVDARDLESGRWEPLTRDITVACATDGNHGRSVAWGARRFHCHCVIFVHPGVSEARRRAIASYGAEVREIAGNYDDSVRAAARTAAREGWIVVSDTSYPGYERIPRRVMQGYGVMALEAIAQLPPGTAPTHLFAQAGVGGMAAAVLATFWHHFGAARPRFVVVEPESADSLLRSAKAGSPVVVEGDLDTIMAGLSSGEVSPLAWSVLERGADAFMTIPDAAAIEAMRLLACPPWGGAPIEAGESGVAGLAALRHAVEDPRMAAQLGLGPASVVLLFGTEGATDPALYARIVGTAPQGTREAA